MIEIAEPTTSLSSTNQALPVPVLNSVSIQVPTSTTSGDPTTPAVITITNMTLIRLGVLLEGFVQHLTTKNPHASTGQTYGKRLRFFLAWLRHRTQDGPRQLDRLEFDAYRQYLDQRFRSPLAKNGYLVAVRQFTKFIAGYFPGTINQAEFVKGWSGSRDHTRRHLPVDDAKALLHALQTDGRKTEIQRRRNVALGYLMLKTGLRQIEISRAQIEYLQEDVPGKTWRLWVQGKGRTSADDYVRLVPDVYEKIQSYLTLRMPGLNGRAPLFTTTACYDRAGNVLSPEGRPLSTRAINRIITEGLLLAGAKKPGIVAHSLRHSTPTYALLNKANPIQVQRMMRHKHYATTEVYVKDVQRMIDGAEDSVTQI